MEILAFYNFTIITLKIPAFNRLILKKPMDVKYRPGRENTGRLATLTMTSFLGS